MVLFSALFERWIEALSFRVAVAAGKARHNNVMMLLESVRIIREILEFSEKPCVTFLTI
jgi:hypothetical protein